MTGRKISAVLMTVPERELMGEVLLRESGEAVLPVHVNIVKLHKAEDGTYVHTEDKDDAVKKRQLANAKERLRVRSLNTMFSRLKRIVPVMPLGRKPSKVDMLRAATEYIRLLSAVLHDANNNNNNITETAEDFVGSVSSYSNPEFLYNDLWSVEEILEGVTEGVAVSAPAVTAEIKTEVEDLGSVMMHPCQMPTYQYIVQLGSADQAVVLNPFL